MSVQEKGGLDWRYKAFPSVHFYICRNNHKLYRTKASVKVCWSGKPDRAMDSNTELSPARR